MSTFKVYQINPAVQRGLTYDNIHLLMTIKQIDI